MLTSKLIKGDLKGLCVMCLKWYLVLEMFIYYAYVFVLA